MSISGTWFGRVLAVTALVLVGGCPQPSPHGLVDRAKDALGNPMHVSRCFDTLPKASLTTRTGDSTSLDTLGLPLLGGTESVWSAGQGDSVTVTLFVYVAGTARPIEGGYPSYTAILDSRVDTIRAVAVPEASGTWKVVCEGDVLPYSEIRDLADPGFYTNPDIFREIVRRADSSRAGVAH